MNGLPTTDNAAERIVIHQPADIVTARRSTRLLCEKLGFGRADQTRLATAVSELTRNCIQYADGGVCWIGQDTQANHLRVWVVVEDQGPGIPDLEAALSDGFSTSGGLGAGLPGTRRLVDQFHIESRPGSTCVVIGLLKRRES